MSSNVPGRQVFSVVGFLEQGVRDPELRARPGGVTQFVWESYKQKYLEAGQEPPPLGVQMVNRLYSVAAEKYRAERELGGAIETFRRTGLDQALTGRMFARDYDTPGGALPGSDRPIRVRFGVQVSYYGETYTRYLTWEPGLEVPQSTSGLLDALADVGASRLEQYGEEFDALSDEVSLSWL